MKNMGLGDQLPKEIRLQCGDKTIQGKIMTEKEYHHCKAIQKILISDEQPKDWLGWRMNKQPRLEPKEKKPEKLSYALACIIILTNTTTADMLIG